MKLYYPIFAACFLFVGCDVEKTEEGEAPEIEVDVETEAGEVPEYDVDWAKVDVGSRTKTVKVPKVVVVMEEQEVDVPYLDLEMPDSESEASERTIMVEVEVGEFMHEIDIEKVYAKGNNLIVVSELEKGDEPLEENRVRISDQIIINAPTNLTVKHYIVGERPAGGFNADNDFIQSESEISAQLNNAELIHEG